MWCFLADGRPCINPFDAPFTSTQTQTPTSPKLNRSCFRSARRNRRSPCKGRTGRCWPPNHGQTRRTPSTGLQTIKKGCQFYLIPGAQGHDPFEYTRNAFIALATIHGLIPTARASLADAQKLDPRLKDAATKGLNQLAQIERISMNQLDQDCGNYLTPVPPMWKGPHVDYGSIAYGWCKDHHNDPDRWTKFPVHS